MLKYIFKKKGLNWLVNDCMSITRKMMMEDMILRLKNYHFICKK